MGDEEDEEKIEKVYNERIIHHTDIKYKEMEERIIRYANDAIVGENLLDKEVATKLKELLDGDPILSKVKSNPNHGSGQFEESELGVWQTVVGRAFSSSVTFDAEYLIYFSFPKLSKYFLVFRS